MMEPEHIAEVCHEANRAYCEKLGDTSQKPWKETSWSLKQSAIGGVVFLIENPEASLSSLHERWYETRKAQGWSHGEQKSEEHRTHPCMVPYEQLPDLQKRKDVLFRAVVKALTTGEL